MPPMRITSSARSWPYVCWPRVHDLTGSEAGAQRESPTERLSEAYQIGKDPLAFVLEHDTGATKPREDFIEDEE